MYQTLGSIMMLLGGTTLVIVTFYHNHREIIETEHKNNNILNKYLKYKKLLNLILGFSFIILGIIPILNIYNGDLIWILSSIILICDRVIDFVITKKYKLIN